MGQDRGSWFPPERFSSLSHRMNSSLALSHSGYQNQNLVSKEFEFSANMVSVCGSSPAFAQLPRVGGDKSRGLVYGLSNLESPFALPQKNYMKQIPSASLFRNQVESVKVGEACTPKRFLVFDQSGDQTTLIFSSGIGKPFQGVATQSLKEPVTSDMKRDFLRTNEDLAGHGMLSREVFADDIEEPDAQSEMHEDTEELNALLYSDDESDNTDEEDEVTSSGHSPGNQEAYAGSTEGVSAIVGRPRDKKRKLLEGSGSDYETLTTPHNTSNTGVKRIRSCSGDEDGNDAESSCGSCSNTGSFGQPMMSSNRKIGKEKMSETLSLLRSIVPGGEEEDPIFVIDRAIDYLKSLKTNAQTLGIESLSSLED